jgi:integrase
MSLRKRGGIWWVDVVAPNGERIRRTAGTANKALAQEFHDRLKSELWRIAKLGEKPQRTWNEAVVRWLKEKSHKATIKGDVNALRWLDAFLGGKDLAIISRATLDQIADEKLARGCSNATVNRTLALVRAILRKCVNEWEWLERAPQVRLFPEPTRRIRALTHEEAQRLLAELPEHLADMAAFSLATGLRASNVTGLQWQQVDLTRQLAWVHPDQAKARRAISVPLNGEAMALVRKQVGKHPTNVFSFRGRRSSRSAPKPGTRRLSAPASRIFAGMTFGTAGRRGTCRTARRCSRCRSWAVGRVRRWCGGTRTLPPITWRLTRNVCALFGPSKQKITARLRHKGDSELVVTLLLSRFGLVPAVGIEPTTNGLEIRWS